MAFESLSDKLAIAFKRLKSKGKLNEHDIKEAMREVKMALLEADVNFKVVKDFVKSISEKAIGVEVFESLTPAQQVIKIVNDELCLLMGDTNQRINFPSKLPCVVMMCGLQGAGKTTQAAKLAKFFVKQSRRPLLVACDIYRPAAIEQLKIVGENAGVPVFEQGQIPPIEIARNAIRHAKDYGNDIVILDTAGRLHIDDELMGELSQIKLEIKPHEIILVVDSMTGQDAVNVAKTFNEQLDIDSVILTKLDGDTRGGAALSVLAVTGCPIKFCGIGEKLDDFEAFHPERMASRILGMGDVLTLIEKAQDGLDEKKSRDMMKKIKDDNFDMNDLLEQMSQIQNMGSMSQILSMIPGLGNKIKDADIDESQFIKIKAMITSMTKKEREKPSIINPNRKKRIASGSGTRVEDVNRLLKQFEQMQKMMKQMKGFKKGKKKSPMARMPF